MDKLPLSAIVVAYNEAHLLPACLASLNFCDELIVVDVASTDDTAAVAGKFATAVYSHPWVPIGEQALSPYLPLLRHEWVLRADPDEVFPPILAEQIGRLLADIPEDVAAIALPYRHIVLGKPIRYTSWGLLNGHAIKIYRRKLMRVTGHVHHGVLIPKGSEIAFIHLEAEDSIQHNTMPTVKHRIEKTLRYTRIEGESRYARGMRFRVSEMLLMPLRILWRELYFHQGWRDGWIGITIAVMLAWYELLSWLSLRRWQLHLNALASGESVRSE